jgi:hypothetical protein
MAPVFDKSNCPKKRVCKEKSFVALIGKNLTGRFMYKQLFLFLALVTVGFSHAVENEDFLQTKDYLESGSSALEPPIYVQYTSKRQTIKDQGMVLNTFFETNLSNTTSEGKKLFTPGTDGLYVNEPGLYRISFFQYVGTLDDECQLTFNLDRVWPTSYENLHMKNMELGKRGSTEIQFTQIVRMNAGDKFRLTLGAYKGEAVILNGTNVSGLTVEAIVTDH